MSLNNLAGVLSILGRLDKALAYGQEAVDLRRGLSREHPTEFTPDLAMSLTNLAGFLLALGCRDEALASVQEAVDLRRGLSREHPNSFSPGFATSLGVLGRILRADEPVKARDCFIKAIETLTPIFLRYPMGHVQLMNGLIREYLATVEQMHETPNEALLAPIVEVFRQLQANDEPQA